MSHRFLEFSFAVYKASVEQDDILHYKTSDWILSRIVVTISTRYYLFPFIAEL